MKILEVIESKRWKNRKTGRTASIYGSTPWSDAIDACHWEVETVGYTWRLDNGTVGLGRRPVETREEALNVMQKFNGGES